jgi:hypothetical protein
MQCSLSRGGKLADSPGAFRGRVSLGPSPPHGVWHEKNCPIKVHDEEQKVRQQRASSLNVEKRNEITSHANQHAAETQSIMDSLRRASGL